MDTLLSILLDTAIVGVLYWIVATSVRAYRKAKQ